ncbi:ABC transporter ATP-binding protein [Nitratifractor salsuginis]|uniref:Amino acid/amide ABC transporter ATP-binding protein 1, HAAT family n=1 Tax=Nitratifractor salsuginis (strain DSM 16511 / JCM 12458 / E9I37-1) TaxID=749222 RepID=E6X2E1_NITSE|nr:ABC transporter ATP-binding protein [Nitratifractor salsuginis]ADV46076.1 amino acid/amide ABC transporter ATP-binding protein 1, HAAT family [Nitratifractor salsuginis DSM 16511]
MSEPLLEVRNVTMKFGGVTAIDNLSFTVDRGEIYGLIGPNGAGKTTIFNIITGNYFPTEGSIIFDGEDITGTKPHKVVEKGIARTFQNIRLFKSMTVLENVLIGFHDQIRYNYFEAILRLPRYHIYEKRIRAEAMGLLEEFGIAEFADYNATALSYGNQRKVEIARALATKPKLLLLDEPAAGMNPKETADLSDIIHKIKKDYDLTVLLIEHDMKFVNAMCDEVTVLDYGEKIFEGKPADAIVDPRVVTAYLGEFTNA